ncbi:uncharacterized protein LOC123917959 [Trifolium pratense]|uniref:uncharacterized protein LOC123917959 n=1 Tax=Trifolium pratense TaxID=57577 RepID=UPI001E692068|nr:uncharacterized protein LOC123917959 [Trifolium pratense]
MSYKLYVYRCGRIESERQLENTVGVEDRADDEHRDSSFNNDEYSSSDGEIGGRSDEEISGNVDDGEFEGEFEMSSTDESGEEDCDADKININCEADIFKIDMKSISVDVAARLYFADLDIDLK